MKFIKDVVCSFKPEEIDNETSSTTTYIRSNFREFKLDDDIFYRYDETQYTKEEYEKIDINNKLLMLEKDIADIILEISGGI